MNKKIIGIIIFMLLIGIILNATANTIIDKIPLSIKNGNTLYVGGSGPKNYTYIQSAIDDANDGDTVFVYEDNSPYYDNLIIDKRIFLIGENKDTTIIDGNYRSDVIKVYADSIKINGFTIQHSSSSPNYKGAGVRIDNTSDCIISDCKIFENREYGILIYNSQKCHVTGNIISVSRCGVFIESGVFSNQDFCYNRIEENIIKNNTWGVSIVRNKNKVKIQGNIIINNSIDGINTFNIFNSIEIKKNIISGNKIGIDESGSPQFKKHKITITENEISSNYNYGLLILESHQIVIFKNNFENNNINAYFQLSRFKYLFTIKWYRLLKGNYWDDYTGTSAMTIQGEIHLSIGMLWSKKIPWEFYDYFPAKEPYDI